jgi:hypothetical protein
MGWLGIGDQLRKGFMQFYSNEITGMAKGWLFLRSTLTGFFTS